MLVDISGAGAQLPMRSHWKLCPGPQSHKNSEQQCRRDRANTASNNASATGQTQSQQTARQALSGKRPSNRNLRPCPTASTPTTRGRPHPRVGSLGAWAERVGLHGSHIPFPPVLLASASNEAYVASAAPCSLAVIKATRRAACAGPAWLDRRRLRRSFDDGTAVALAVPAASPAVATLSCFCAYVTCGITKTAQCQ